MLNVSRDNEIINNNNDDIVRFNNRHNIILLCRMNALIKSRLVLFFGAVCAHTVLYNYIMYITTNMIMIYKLKVLRFMAAVLFYENEIIYNHCAAAVVLYIYILVVLFYFFARIFCYLLQKNKVYPITIKWWQSHWDADRNRTIEQRFIFFIFRISVSKHCKLY